jgi:hypothetical protein
MRFSFEWDEEKNRTNIEKHHINFYEAQKAFLDLNRVVLKDLSHSDNEDRYFCLGKVEEYVLTVRFTVRNNTIRIFGAGYWRKGKKIYEQKNKIQ